MKVKTLLEKESLEDLTKSNSDTSAERKSLEDQIKQLKEELNNKNNKIEALEKIINTKKETVATQVMPTKKKKSIF